MRILLDLDEILSDFVGGACRAFNVDTKEVEHLTTNSVWGSLIPVIGKIKGFNLTPEFFWAVIHQKGERFWEELEPLPWATQVLDLVKSLTDDWHIISAPSACPTSYGGKVKWLKNYFGKDFDRFALTPHKHIFAGPDVLLIDDRDKNVEDFINAGGVGLVFPRHHNSLHRFKDDPVGHIRRIANSSFTTGVPRASQISQRELCLQGDGGGYPYGFDPDQAVS